MKLLAYLSQLAVDPVRIGIGEKLIAASACLAAILLTALITQWSGHQTPVLLASMGASAVILFVVHGSPLAQPWPFSGGHMISGMVGIGTAYFVDDLVLASALAVGGSVSAMLMMRCLHPPGAATALVPVLNAAHTIGPDFEFLLAPLGLNVASMLFLTLVINRLILRRAYPAGIDSPGTTNSSRQIADRLAGISPSDIEQATSDFKQFIDIGTDDLCLIFTRLQLMNFRKHHGSITCGEIMQENSVTVEYATELESAWALMQEQHLKALPVLDRSRRVIGIVTRHDFLKNLKLTPYQSFQDKWLAFIKRTPANNTDKPEAIGHIMTRKVKTLPASAHIAELIPLMINEGHHHIPIVDSENRFVGMVIQSRLLAALFNQQTAKIANPDLSKPLQSANLPAQ